MRHDCLFPVLQGAAALAVADRPSSSPAGNAALAAP